MSNLNQKIEFADIVKQIDKYDFKCKLATIRANIEICDKDSDKLVVIVPMVVSVTNGTMNPAYAKDFFNDLIVDAKPYFVKEVLRNEKKTEDEAN